MSRCCHRGVFAGVVLLLLSSSPVLSQQAGVYQDLLLSLRDTLAPIRTSVTGFTRDLRETQADSILVHAASLRSHCRAAVLAVPGAIEKVGPATQAGRARRQATSMLAALRGLDFALRNCELGFDTSGPGDRADTLRVWGVFRSNEVEQALRAYDLTATRFAEAVGVSLGEQRR